MHRRLKRAEESFERTVRPKDVEPQRGKLPETKSFFRLELKDDNGRKVTMSKVFGRVVVYLGKGKTRAASAGETKRYLKAIAKKEKEFFKKK